MSALMATEKRLRVSFDAKTETIRRAIYIAAAMKGMSHNDILNELIEEHFAEYIRLAAKAIDDEGGDDDAMNGTKSVEPAPKRPKK